MRQSAVGTPQRIWLLQFIQCRTSGRMTIEHTRTAADKRSGHAIDSVRICSVLLCPRP